MNLYTEKQVIDFTMSMISQYEFGNKNIWNKELLKESLNNKTQITLPSDEDMKTFKDLLKELDAHEEIIDWADDKTIEQVVAECHRGDWLEWLAKKTNVDKRKTVLAGGLCANTVRHLMKDERSTKAVDVAIAYGKGEASDEELNADAWAAADAAYAAAWANTYAADAAAAVYAAADAAKTANLLQTADICREVMGKDIIKKVNKLLK